MTACVPEGPARLPVGSGTEQRNVPSAPDVAEAIARGWRRVFPQAEVFAVVDFVPEASRGFLQGKPVHTTFIQRLPLARRLFRQYLPLMPLAVEQLDLSGFDIVISSSHAVAKGVLTGPDQLHVSYVHSPLRYAWDMQHEYLREAGMARGLKSLLTRWLLHRLRLWDVRTANGVDQFVANSAFIARRVRKAYRREAEVIYPPVDLSAFIPSAAARGDENLSLLQNGHQDCRGHGPKESRDRPEPHAAADLRRDPGAQPRRAPRLGAARPRRRRRRSRCRGAAPVPNRAWSRSRRGGPRS